MLKKAKKPLSTWDVLFIIVTSAVIFLLTTIALNVYREIKRQGIRQVIAPVWDKPSK